MTVFSRVTQLFSPNRVGETLQTLSSNEELRYRLARLQGNDRPETPSAPPWGGLLDQAVFRRVEALGRFWSDSVEGEPVRAMSERMISFFTGMAAGENPCLFLMSGFERRLLVSVGTLRERGESLDLQLRAHFPGARLTSTINRAEVDEVLRLPHCHLLAGIPWRLPDNQRQISADERTDRLVRGLLYGPPWALLVIAQPLPYAQGGDLVDGWSAVIERARVEFQQSGTLDELSRLGELYIELLEAQLERALRGHTRGNWLAETYLLSQTAASAALAAGALSGDESRPEPFRALRCAGDAGRDERLQNNATWLSSSDLASIVQFPLHEYPGYAVKPIARFDVDSPEQPSAASLRVGWIQDLDVPTGHPFALPQDRLTTHALVAGTTGSGKTNTAFHILEQLRENGVPFLVIEPVKGEYRALRSSFSDLKLITVGSDEAPLRVNPFYVPSGVSVQTHLDYLLSLFAASFVLYAPMPYVLESALQEVYTDKGWDLVSGACTRDRERSERAFPTLTDLYHKVDEVVERLGYGQRIERDVRAALHARLNSLRMGSKGAMLDTRDSLNVRELLSRPYVVEMQAIGDDDQKAFLMGLLLTLVYEHYRSKGPRLGAEKLGHVTLIEEAHRLLQRSPRSTGEDFANPRTKAIQTFSNIIAEIRAYGEGIVIIEQSPVKLASDVLKNANLKVIHRIVSGDDRKAIAAAMPLSEEQREVIVGLRRGHAVLFTGGMDQPVLVHIPKTKSRLVPSSWTRDSLADQRDVEASAVSWARLTLADGDEVRRAFSRWLLSSTYGEAEQAERSRSRLVSVMRSVVPVALRTTRMEERMVAQTIPRLADWLTTNMGRLYSWRFGREARLYDAINEQWVNHARRELLEENLRLGTSVAVEPYEACSNCSNPCLFRFFARLAIGDLDQAVRTTGVLDRYSTRPTENAVRQLALHARFVSQSVVEPGIPDVTEGVGLCALITAAHRMGWPESVISEMAQAVSALLGGGAEHEEVEQ